MRFIYLHGFASSPASRKAQYFRTQFAQHEVDLEIPFLDQGDFSRLTISGQLGLVEKLLKGEPAVLVGSSMGGYLAALYAAAHPEIARIVLMAPAFGFASRWREMTGQTQLDAWRTSGWMDVYHYGERAKRPVHYSLLADALVYPGNPPFTQPALIFHGISDTVVPIELSRRFAVEHANTKLVELVSDHELGDVLENIASQSMPFLLAAAQTR